VTPGADFNGTPKTGTRFYVHRGTARVPRGSFPFDPPGTELRTPRQGLAGSETMAGPFDGSALPLSIEDAANPARVQALIPSIEQACPALTALAKHYLVGQLVSSVCHPGADGANRPVSPALRTSLRGQVKSRDHLARPRGKGIYGRARPGRGRRRQDLFTFREEGNVRG